MNIATSSSFIAESIMGIGIVLAMYGGLLACYTLIESKNMKAFGWHTVIMFIGLGIIAFGGPALAPVPETTPTPDLTPAPAPIDINWDIIGVGVLAVTAVTVLGATISAVRRRTRRAAVTYATLHKRFAHQQQRLNEVMAAFTAATIDPNTVLRYPLYLAGDHPVNRRCVDAMMDAYAKEAVLKHRIVPSRKRDAEHIDIAHFTVLVDNAVAAWDELNYEAKATYSPLLPLDLEQRAQKLLALATDETTYPSEREHAMERLITLLTDARVQLRGNDAMLVDAVLDTVTTTKRAGSVLTAPAHVRDLAVSYPTLMPVHLTAITA